MAEVPPVIFAYPGFEGVTEVELLQSERAAAFRRILLDPVALWCAFALVHFALALLNLYGPGFPINDITSVYKFWVDQALVSGYWVGVDGTFVYPILALVPMLASEALYPIARAIPGLAGLAQGPGLFAVTWMVLVTALDAIALAVITGWGRRPERFVAGWWWIGFLLALGPISLGRIDVVSVALAMVGVALIADRPRVASVLLTLAAWVKVWPGVIAIAMVVALRDRWRILATAVGVSAAIVLFALSYGSGLNVLSFVTEQTGRGLQVEAPVTLPWMWQAWAGVPGATVYFDDDILTWQVTGTGVGVVSALMNPLLIIAVAAVTTVAVVLVRTGASPAAILPPLVLALVTGLIVFQKVGSPQFVSWLAVPVVLGIVTRLRGHGPSFRTPAALVLVIAALTQVIYPFLYGYLLGLYPAMLFVLTVRNLLLIVLFVFAVVAMVRSSRFEADAAAPATPHTPRSALPDDWPRPRGRATVESEASNGAAPRI